MNYNESECGGGGGGGTGATEQLGNSQGHILHAIKALFKM